MKSGIELIAEERQKQIEKHGIEVLEDVQNNDSGQLSLAASFLISSCKFEDYMQEALTEYCPPDWNEERWLKMCNKTFKERLIISGALIAAELDRLNFINSTDK